MLRPSGPLSLLLVASAKAKTCFDARFTWEACCHESFGPAGNPSCWDENLQYIECCGHDAWAPFVKEMQRLEALPAISWWDEQLEVLKSAESTSAASILHMRPTQISFVQLLDALVSHSKRNNYVLNIGGGSGKELRLYDPAYPLLHKANFSGLVVEGSEKHRDELQAELGKLNASGNVHLVIETARKDNVETLMRTFAVPQDLDALKIDIDSFDLVVLEAILEAGYNPKLINVEINPDIPPPFQWHLAGGWPNHYQGVYGVSPDKLFQILSIEHAYSLVAVELMDVRQFRDIPNAWREHNMWFVRNDLIARKISGPLVTWHGMVRLFWGQMQNVANTAYGKCLHMRPPLPCFLTDIERLAARLGYGGRRGSELSIFLASDRVRNIVLEYAKRFNQALVGRCGGGICSVMTVANSNTTRWKGESFVA